MTFQIADVTKPLASAARSTAKGHRIVLDDKDAHIQHKATGCRTKLHKKGNMFVMRVRTKPELDVQRTTIAWTSMSGLTRQED